MGAALLGLILFQLVQTARAERFWDRGGARYEEHWLLDLPLEFAGRVVRIEDSMPEATTRSEAAVPGRVRVYLDTALVFPERVAEVRPGRRRSDIGRYHAWLNAWMFVDRQTRDSVLMLGERVGSPGRAPARYDILTLRSDGESRVERIEHRDRARSFPIYRTIQFLNPGAPSVYPLDLTQVWGGYIPLVPFVHPYATGLLGLGLVLLEVVRLLEKRGRARIRTGLGCLLAIALLAGPLGAQGTPARDATAPAHDTLTIASRALGETRRIHVHTPPGYGASTAARFPTLYMPDGGLDEDFPHVVHAVDSLIAAGAIRPVIVVGIPNTERRRDLTGPTRFAADSAIAPRVGGSGAFRGFIRDELIPAVQKRYRTTDERAIVGESLAGLFIVETLLLEPGLFDHYVALDPSLWWNGGALLDAAPARLAGLDARLRTLYLAHSDESRIAADAARLDSLLRAAPRRGLAWVYAPRPDLTHGTIFRGVEAAALASALR